MKQPENVKIFQNRREQVVQQLKSNEMVVLFSQPIYYRQHDIPFPYRQESSFYYLTGFEEPNSCLILQSNSPQSILFVQENSAEREQWDGALFGSKRAEESFLMDECYSIDQFPKVFQKWIKNKKSIYRIQNINKDFDKKMSDLILEIQKESPRVLISYEMHDARKLIAPMRMIKEDYEIEQIKKACEVSSQAHIEVMKACRPHTTERALHGVFIQSIMNQNSKRESYSGIFASGKNALILHYIDNDQVCQDGELMLVDAGGEWNYYASDLTRTFPVNGKFSAAQKLVYSVVLNIQKSLIEMIKPNISVVALQNRALEMVQEFIEKEKILPKASKSDVKKLYPHNFGHLLGLDVHDVQMLEEHQRNLILKEKMVLTVEPGLYIPYDDRIPKEFQGIGIRIEDNILVTSQGAQVLSHQLPKEVQEIEQIMV